MKCYSYVIPRDYGFAPNPYFDYCTLATCKPKIRKAAHVGDWIAAYGSARSSIKGCLVVMMRVDETLTFNQYWQDIRFRIKRPVFNKGIMHMYGDNIYHTVNGKWMQEHSHHSLADGQINEKNLIRDTQTNRVLISSTFFYFGQNAIKIPTKFSEVIFSGRNYKKCDVESIIIDFVDFLEKNYQRGIRGIPYSREVGKFMQYSGE